MGMLPIRKISDSTVALTTFYGKNFVRRSERSAHDYGKWIANQITAIGLDQSDDNVIDVKFKDVFDPSVRLPKDYSSISKRISSFKSNGYVFYFDFDEIEENFDAEQIKLFTKDSLVPVAKSTRVTLGMDSYGMLFKYGKDGLIEVGTITDLIGIDSAKAPLEFTELSMMGKSMPLWIILSYYYGLEEALRLFGVEYRTTYPDVRVSADEADIIIKCQDGKIVINFNDRKQRLVFNGIVRYLKVMKEYNIEDFNHPNVYLNLVQSDGMSIRYLNELSLMDSMYVDPISERILKQMGEPTTFRGLLLRSNEMLIFDDHPDEIDMEQQHIYGKQRIAGAVYTALTRAMRDYHNQPSGRRKLEVAPKEVWQSIASDPSVLIVPDANPLQSIKEADVVTLGGTGGRSKRSLVKRARKYDPNSLGVISGDTVDSGDVGITSYKAANPKIKTLDGILSDDIERGELSPANFLSNSTLLAPGAMNDDGKRLTIY